MITFENVVIGEQFFKAPVLLNTGLWTKISASSAWCVGETVLTPFAPEDLVIKASLNLP